MAKPVVKGKCLLCGNIPHKQNEATEKKPVDTDSTPVHTNQVASERGAKPKARKLKQPFKIPTIKQIGKTMRKVFKALKIALIVIVASFVISAFPGLITGTASAVLWGANTVTGLTGKALAMASDNAPKPSKRDTL